MSTPIFEVIKSPFVRMFPKLGNFERDQSGIVAVEFAMVITPFLMLLFGIMKLGIIFFTMFSLDNAVEQTARLVRTGQAGAVTKADFKAQICARVPGYMNCADEVRVDVQSDPDLANLTPPSGTNGGGGFQGDGDFSYTPGSGGDYALVTVFYKWSAIPFQSVLNIGNMDDGSFLIRSAAAFRNEPFTDGG